MCGGKIVDIRGKNFEDGAGKQEEKRKKSEEIHEYSDGGRWCER